MSTTLGTPLSPNLEKSMPNDWGPAASGGQTVLANDRNGGRLRLITSRHMMTIMMIGVVGFPYILVKWRWAGWQLPDVSTWFCLMYYSHCLLEMYFPCFQVFFPSLSFGSVCLYVCLSVRRITEKVLLWTDFDEISWRGRAWPRDQRIQFWWRSRSLSGSRSPKTEICIHWIIVKFTNGFW